MALVKKCRHGRGKAGRARERAWRSCTCTWYADLRVDGVRVYVPAGADHAAARVTHARLLADREAGRLSVHAAARTVDEVIAAWLGHLRAASPPTKPATLAAYESRMRVARAWFGNAPITGVTARDVVEFGADVAAHYSRDYAHNIRTTFGAVLAWAVDAGILEHNPAAGVRVRAPSGPRVRGNANHVPLPDVERVIAALPDTPPLRDMAAFALLTGLRLGELCGVRAQDVDLARGAVAVVEQDGAHGVGAPKTATSHRVVPLTAGALELVRRHMVGKAPGDRVFDVRYRHASERLRDTLRAVDLYAPGRGWHMFRHANTVLRDRAGESLRSTAAALGHGRHTAQTLAYGWAAEVGAAPALDDVRATLSGGHATPSAGVDEGTPPPA